MKKSFSKLGFTLIELLAAIIIIGVIIVITIPMVFNIIEFVKMEAFRATAYSIADSGRLLVANENETQGYQEFYYNNGIEYNADSKKLDYTGKGPKTGIVILNKKNKVVLAIHNGTYCATKSADTNKITVTKIAPDDCNAYSIIETCDTWEQIAIKYDVSLEDLLAENNETDSNSSTCNRDIKIPVSSTPSSSSYVGDGGATVYYKTYYTVGYVSSSVTLPFSYEYTIKLGALPLNIADIETVNVTAESVFESLDDFKRYITKKNMGEVIWQEGDSTPIDINQAPILRDHAADSSNMSSDNVTVSCDTEACYATVRATVSNLTYVIPNTIDGVGQVAYTPIKFTVEFNGDKVCPTAPTPDSCFVFDTATGTITDYNYTTEGCPSDVVIPSTIGGVAVNSIGSSSFASSQLTCVVFPSTAITIGSYAFESNNFTTLTIPESVTSISNLAFRNNNFIDGVNWNTNIDSVGGWDFAIFSNATISSFTFGKNVTKIPSNILSSSNYTGGTITIPNSVVSIGKYAFKDADLTSLTIPSNVASIGNLAFANNSLTGGVRWNANIDSVGGWDFAIFNNSTISSFTFGENVTKIPSNVLSNSNYTGGTITIPESVASIGQYAFYAADLTSLTIPSNVTSISTKAFANNNLTGGVIWNANIDSVASWDYPIFLNSIVASITFGNNITKIPSNILSQAVFLAGEVTIPESVTSIGQYAFYAADLKTLTISSNVTTVGTKAFANNNFTDGVVWNANIDSVASWDYPIFLNSTIPSFVFGNNVTKIPSNILSRCNFTGGTINIPEGVTSIGQYAFKEADLTSLTVPSSVTTVGTKAFANNNFTGGVIWNANIDSVGMWDYPIFEGSTIPSITFGNNVTKIPNAFLSKSVISSGTITIPSTIKSIGYRSFYGTAMTSIIIPVGVETIGSGAFLNNSFTTVAIPSSVSSIGDSAFNMTSLTSATIDNTLGSVSFGSTPFGTVTPTYLR